MTRHRPNADTSHYGWALWHLEQAERGSNVDAMAFHVAAAQARATLALVSEMGVMRGVDPDGPFTWTGWEPGEENQDD